MNLDLLRVINKELEEGKSGVLCTVVRAGGSTPRDLGACMWVRCDGSSEGTIGGGPTEKTVTEKALEMIKEGRQEPILHEAIFREKESGGQSVCGGEATILLEPLGFEPEIVIFGAGHVGRALARLAAATGYKTTVWDDREEYANPERIPWGRNIACPLEDAFKEGRLSLDGRSYVVVVTRGHVLDEEVVRKMEGYPVAYLGVIGSRKKIAAVRQRLIESGVKEEFLDGIYQPVGLPIGSETPEEIAVSVLAEIIAVRRGAEICALRSAYGEEVVQGRKQV
ncbi:MAG: hypothetical protein XD80_1169 [Synergistales bacterium 53_16]|nr:MAG: hypothetical protein XD80_1169 [Synergistales bacterium 53_16]